MADLAPDQRSAPSAPEVPPPPGLVADDADWELVAEGYAYTDGPAADTTGAVYFAEPIFGHLYKAAPNGEVTKVVEQTKHAMGLVMGADGLIYACRNQAAQIVRYTPAGEMEVLLEGEMTPLPGNANAPGEFCNDMAVNRDGGVWFTDRINKQVMYLAPDGSVRRVAGGFRPNGIVLSADRKMLAVTDSNEPRLHAFEVGENGELEEMDGFFDPVRTVEQIGSEQESARNRPGTNGMTVDSDGRFYVTSFYGIQIFDRDGKYLGVINKGRRFASNLTFGGPDYQWLYITSREGVFRLRMQVSGVHWQN